MNSDICPLCGRSDDLIESHVLPAFVFRWMKETSINGYLRFAENPGRRVQDGLKYRWLCIHCERRLNGFETPFATKIFRPYSQDDGKEYRYGPWLMKFCASVSWRVLRHYIDRDGLAEWPESMRNKAHRALESWRAVIFDEIPHPGIYEQHLLPLGAISNSTIPGLPNNMNRYFMRAVDMDMATGGVTAFAYAKMGRFALFGLIASGRDPWRGARVSPSQGVIQPKQYQLPRAVGDYLMERAKKIGEVSAAIPEEQQDRIEAAALKNIDRMVTSDQFKAMLEDERMFGLEAILRKPKPKE